MKSLRSYQNDVKNTVSKRLQKGVDSQVIVLPTGTGKTFTACKIAEEYQSCLWITHREELIDQSALALSMTLDKDPIAFKEEVEKCGGYLDFLEYYDKSFEQMDIQVGVIKQDRMDLDCHYVVASIQTLHRRLDSIDPDQFDLIIIDEAHLAMAETWKKSIEHFNHKLRIGLTATPTRMDGLSLFGLFKEISYQYDMGSAIHDGWLVPINAVRCETLLSLDQVRTVAGEFNQKDLSHVVDCSERNNLIVDKYEKYGNNQQAIFYCVDINHAVNLCNTFVNRGHDCDVVVSDTSVTGDRRATLRKFRSGELKIITNVDILTTGFDYPDLRIIGTACPTKSLVKYIQTVGRGTRPTAHSINTTESAEERKEAIKNSTKPELLLLDFVDLTSKHRLVNAWELDKRNRPSERTFSHTGTTDSFLSVLERDVKIDGIVHKDQSVDLIPLPEVSISKSPRMKEPATEKQMMYLMKLGLYVSGVFYTKGDAAHLISKQQASVSQVKTLLSYGFDAKGDTTLGEFQEAMNVWKMNNNREVSQYVANKYGYTNPSKQKNEQSEKPAF